MDEDVRPPRLEFRIPISPTDGFFSQVRFFNFALRRLGGAYATARLTVVVGDHCDIDDVRRRNRWSDNDNIRWEPVPHALFDTASMWGTANWRLNLAAGDADIVLLCDADTVLLRDIDPILGEFATDHPVVRGHMAHYPAPVGKESRVQSGPDFWPTLLTAYDVCYDGPWERYSMDIERTLPTAPPYFNLAFIAMNAAALAGFAHDIHWTDAWLKEQCGSDMRCQIGMTLIACRHKMDVGCLPAPYNAANDIVHFQASGMAVEDVRVLHYLRGTELDRSSFLLPGLIDDFVERPLELPVNRALQALVRTYRASL